jgi:hypothetical protein
MPRWGLGLVAVTATPFVAVACAPREQVSRVALAFHDTDGGLSGFDCPESRATTSTEPLADCALASCGGADRVSLVVDVFPLGGAPRCASGALLDWCDTHPCMPDLTLRSCSEVPIDAVARGGASTQAVARAVAGLAGTVVIPRAPAGTAVIRVVATATPCAELVADSTFGCDRLIGCAFSCPTVIDGSSPQLFLDLDLGLGISADPSLHDAVCAIGVSVCARTPFGRASQCDVSTLHGRCKKT